MRWRVLLFLFVCLPTGCSKETKPSEPPGNAPPVILSVAVRPTRVLAAQEVIVSCRAQDPEKDLMKYSWEATGGTSRRATSAPW